MFRRKPHHLLTFKLAPGVAMNLLCFGKGNAYVGKGMLLRTSVSSGRMPIFLLIPTRSAWMERPLFS